MKGTLETLETSEKKFAAELDAAQKEFAALQEQAADFDPIELYDARQVIRPDKEQDAVCKLQDKYTDKYSHTIMVDGKREVFRILGEYAEGQEIGKIRRERKYQQQHQIRLQSKKKHSCDWER